MTYEETWSTAAFIPFAKLSCVMKCWTVFENFPIKTNGWYL